MNKSGNTSNVGLLQKFAVKSSKKKIIFNDKSVIYNRCSTEKQDSLEWQDQVCSNFCKLNKFKLVRSFGEKESATTDDRIEFQKMLRFCDEEGISNIVIYSYDRFSRSGDIALLEELRDKGIKVHAATQGVDDQTPSGRLSQKLYLMFAEMENEQRRDRIVEGQRNKLRRGEWISTPTIGYEKRFVTGKKEHDLDKRQCYINDEGEILRQAFQWKDRENLTNTAIIERLKKMGLTLTPPQLTRIFRNPFYCGYITSSMLDDGEIIRGKHEALVSEDVFLRVNGLANANTHGWNMLRQNDEMPLKASVRCGICERPLTAYPQKGKYIYYKCPNNGCCVNISNKKLHHLFAAELSKFSISEPFVPLIKAQLNATYCMLHSSEVIREKPMKDELTRLKNELESMEFNLATSKITMDLFMKFSESHKQKINEIEISLTSLANDSSNLDKLLENSVKLYSNLLNMWQMSDYSGKVRLQKLIFPDGLEYLHEKQALRTPKINPIVSAITSISIFNEQSKTNLNDQKTENLHQLYLMFASSNYFWECLSEINGQIIDFEDIYKNNGEDTRYKYFNLSSRTTENVNFNHSSCTKLNPIDTLKQMQDSALFAINSMTGSTSSSTFSK
jgi:site-specific DNA recombinase